MNDDSRCLSAKFTEQSKSISKLADQVDDHTMKSRLIEMAFTLLDMANRGNAPLHDGSVVYLSDIARAVGKKSRPRVE